jgi:phosphate transport system protein
MERISDHSTNIAKSVVFLIEGDDIRHQGVQEKAHATGGDGVSAA